MKEQTIYIAEDNSRFDDQAACLRYEALCFQVAEALSPLGLLPPGCDFSNGSGYIQHTNPKGVATEIAKIILQHSDNVAAAQWLRGQDVHISWIARHAEGALGNCMDKALFRLQCINYTSKREYGQPFFVANEGKCKNVEIKVIQATDQLIN